MAETIQTVETDVAVVGSGAGGLSAAVTAALLGLRVLVVEKAAVFGGCLAFSGGIPWIPANDHMRQAGMADSADAALRYLRTTVGPTLREDLAAAYLEAAPRMLAFLEERTAVRFVMRGQMPDYSSEVDGATPGGRCLDPAPYDARQLGSWLKRLRTPRPEMTLFGGMMVGPTDLNHLLNATRSPRSALYSLGLILRYGLDRLRYGRASRLVSGNALAARLLRSAIDSGVQFWAESPAVELLLENGAVRGVRVRRADGLVDVRASRGTVVATGGFPQNPEMVKRYIPWADQHRSLAPMDNVGEGISLAIKAGAIMDASTPANAFFTPVSVMRKPDGREFVFPHLITDRGKPGSIAVDRTGRRFTNEADPYHVFVRAMQGTAADNTPRAIPAYLICDANFLRRYGLGMVRPAPFPRRPFLDAGYLLSADTIPALAQRLGVDGKTLQATVETYNNDAREGSDRQFGRGNSRYNHYTGDGSRAANPCNAPLEKAPYYAVRLQTGDIGTSLGVRVDARSRALNAAGLPIGGLYVCGNDMTSMMVGTYATGGITIGPALTFGYIAAHDMRDRNITAAGGSTADSAGRESGRQSMTHRSAAMVTPFPTRS